MLVSVVIPTFNRKNILEKCLNSLEAQILPSFIEDYEVIVVDDGSTDKTVDWLNSEKDKFPHLCLLTQDHGGPARGRNLGVIASNGEIIIFIDSDLIVVPNFISSHVELLLNAEEKYGINKNFTYGSVINTNNFDDPSSEDFKLIDNSFAYFATGNVAIRKSLLMKVGLFDTDFTLYGWEDLELGVRLSYEKVKLIKAPKAIGYHWHPPFTLSQIPKLIEQEKHRAKMALLFMKKHNTLKVKIIIQKTPFHRALWELFTIGGLVNHRTLRPLLKIFIKLNLNLLALELLRIYLNLIYVRELSFL